MFPSVFGLRARTRSNVKKKGSPASDRKSVQPRRDGTCVCGRLVAGLDTGP
jgi:hypothetical protein